MLSSGIRMPLLRQPTGRRRGAACGERGAISLNQPAPKPHVLPHQACSLTVAAVRVVATAVAATAHQERMLQRCMGQRWALRAEAFRATQRLLLVAAKLEPESSVHLLASLTSGR